MTLPIVTHDLDAPRLGQPAAMAEIPNLFGVGAGEHVAVKAQRIGDGIGAVAIDRASCKCPSAFACGAGLVPLLDVVDAIAELGNDPAVQVILLCINSPGGFLAGVSRVAEAVDIARRTKPVATFVDGAACGVGLLLAVLGRPVLSSPRSKLGAMTLAAPPTTEATGDNVAHAVEVHRIAMQQIHRARPDIDRTALRRIARGGVLTGAEALELGLVDGLARHAEDALHQIHKNRSTIQ